MFNFTLESRNSRFSEVIFPIFLFSLFFYFPYFQVSFSVVRSLAAKKPLFVRYNTIQYNIIYLTKVTPVITQGVI